MRQGPFYWHGSTLKPARIYNHMTSKMWDSVTYPFPKFNKHRRSPKRLPHFQPSLYCTWQKDWTLNYIYETTIIIYQYIWENQHQGLYSQDFVNSRSREIRVLTFPIALKFGRYLGSAAAEVPVQFQSDTTIAASNLAASRLHEIWR